MKRRLLAAVSILILTVLVFTACSSTSVVGTWIGQTNKQNVVFKSDGTYMISTPGDKRQPTGRYTVNGKKLSLSYEGYTVGCTFSIKDNVMTLTTVGSDGKTNTTTYKKQTQNSSK